MKNSRKSQTGSEKKAAGTKAVKKKRRKNLTPADKVRAALMAAALILIAVVAFLSVMYLHSVKVRNEAAIQTAAGAAVEERRQELQQEPLPEMYQSAEKSLSAEKFSPAENPPVRAGPVAPGSALAPPIASAGSAVSENRAGESRKGEDLSLPAASRGGIIERPMTGKGNLVFVIDDAGHNLSDLEPFLNFPGPLTIAVLPGLPHSAEAARRVRAAGKELFLHQPMEAIGGQNPGPGAIRLGMGRDEIRAIISRNLDELWPVAGMNNHEGSRVTMDEQVMEIILAFCRERGILFLDSRTTAETAAPKAALSLGMSIRERDVFVDNDQSRESMIGYINTGLRRAQQKGSSIMIGHVWSPKLAPLLAELYPDLIRRGYSFSSVSKSIGGTEL